MRKTRVGCSARRRSACGGSRDPSIDSELRMIWFRLTKRLCYSIAVLALAVASVDALAQEIRVMVSGGFSAAYKVLVPQYENVSGAAVETVFGPSMGTTPGAIPVRLSRGESAEVVIMVRPALDELARKGTVVDGSQ